MPHLLKFLALLLTLLAPHCAWAVCKDHTLTPAANVHLRGDAVMIVTHATSFHDARFSSKRGVDEAVRFAKGKGIPVIYLQDGSPEQYYFMEDCHPDYWVASEGGETGFDMTPSHLYIVGGHLELCLSTTLHEVLLRWSRQAPRDLTVTYFMDAIYSNGRNVEPGDPYYQDFQRFMGIVIYGRPMGEHWPKLTLLETLGVIVKEAHDYQYLEKILPRYDRTFPAGYQVELRLNDAPWRVLRLGAENAPTLRFHFVDSALKFSDPSVRSPFQ